MLETIMHRVVGDEDEDEVEPPELPDELALPYPLMTCVELWNAYREHGIMPVRGGYFDQPRKWRQMIRLFNTLYNPISQAHLDAMFPNRNQDDDEMSSYAALSGEYVRAGWDAFVS